MSRNAEQVKELRDSRRAAGLCTACGKEPFAPTSTQYCELHLAKHRAYQQASSDKRRAASADTASPTSRRRKEGNPMSEYESPAAREQERAEIEEAINQIATLAVSLLDRVKAGVSPTGEAARLAATAKRTLELLQAELSPPAEPPAPPVPPRETPVPPGVPDMTPDSPSRDADALEELADLLEAVELAWDERTALPDAAYEGLQTAIAALRSVKEMLHG